MKEYKIKKVFKGISDDFSNGLNDIYEIASDAGKAQCITLLQYLFDEDYTKQEILKVFDGMTEGFSEDVLVFMIEYKMQLRKNTK